MALASVIKKPIKVVYPDIPSTIRIKKALHCVLYPRDISAASDLICIMWTRTSISSLHGWQPNHFVPLLNKAKRSNVRLSYADAVKTTTTGSSKLSSSNVSTSATRTRCHRTHYTEPKVQTKPNIGRKNSSAQASTSPLKDRTQMKLYQSATTATLDPIAPVQMKRRPTTNACTSREVRHDADYRVKIQRKRRRSTNSKINANTPTTNTVNPKPIIKTNVPISSYFLAKSHIKPSTDKTNKGNTGNNTETHENNTNTNKTNEIDTGNIKTNKENNCDNKNNEINTGDKYETSEEEEILPLAGPGFSWYKKKGKNAGANLIRSEIRMRNEVVMEDQDRKGLIRESVNGTLAENVDCLIEKLSRAGSDRQQGHLKAMISLAKYIMDNGMIVPTQDVAKKYRELKGLKQCSRIQSAGLLETISKHLNVIQVYIRQRGYIIENHGTDVLKLVNSLGNLTTMDQKTINEKVEEAIGNNYETTLQYLDSKRDRDTLNTVLTKITSINFMAKMAKVTDKRSLQRSKNLTMLNLQLFEEMKNSLDKIDDDESKLTEEARRRKKHRILQKMKIEKLRHICKGRGRNLKCEEFEDLAAILEFAFGESDRVDRAGGGLECHPRLTDTVLYRAADSNTVMKHAREIILALAPESFNIYLSSCFNYTQNYKEGSYQAKRHHAGKGVNACISLHKPPRAGVQQLVVNLHWSSHNCKFNNGYGSSQFRQCFNRLKGCQSKSQR